MSISMQSETSKDEIETEDTELEDLVWNLMSRSGLLPQIQGQIAKFIEDNGKAENVHVIPERADKKILGLIFEYLQWVGLKQTNSVLLSETPVDIDLSFIKSNTSDPDYRPELCRIFEDQIETEERGTPTRSQNYSKDEFEDSRLTSASGRQSVRSMDEVDNEASVEEEEEEDNEEQVNNSVGGFNASVKIHSSSFDQKDVHETEQELLDQTPLGVKPLSGGFEMGDTTTNDLLINFDSPVVTPAGRSFDIQRPHVTVRQRFDLSDPFQSPMGNVDAAQLSRTFTVPDEGNNDRNRSQGFFGGTSTLFKIPDVEEDEVRLENVSQERSLRDINQNPQLAKTLDSSAKRKSTREPVRTSPDDESTSDFMETLTIEEDTQDVSIPTTEKGMSSCEHAVSLN